MGKAVSIGIAIMLQLSLLVGGHVYFTKNPKEVAIVVESSYGLTTYQNSIIKVIDKLGDEARYTHFTYGTDKTELGDEANIDSLFRVNFGKIDTSKLDQLYPKRKYDERYLITFTDTDMNGWNVIDVK